MFERIISKVILSLTQKVVGLVVGFVSNWLHNLAMDKLKNKANEANVKLKDPATRLQGNSDNEDILGSFS